MGQIPPGRIGTFGGRGSIGRDSKRAERRNKAAELRMPRTCLGNTSLVQVDSSSYMLGIVTDEFGS